MGRRSTLNLASPRSEAHGRLLRLLDWTGVNQAEVARRLGETENWVSRRVRWETPPNADELERLARVLHVKPCAFVDDRELDGLLSGHEPREPDLPQFEAQIAAEWADLMPALQRHSPERVRTALAMLEWMEREGK